MREETKVGPCSTHFVDHSILERLLAEAAKAEQVGIRLSLAGGEYNLPRQDGHVIKIAVFADDVPPIYGAFRMDLKDRPTVAFEPLNSLD